MLRRLILTLILLPCLAIMAQAGAWPREKGKTFLSNSGQIEGPDAFGFYHPFITLYAEHGLTDHVTAGADLGGMVCACPRLSDFCAGRSGKPNGP